MKLMAGLSRGEIRERMGLKGNKSGEMSVSDALTALTKAGRFTGRMTNTALPLSKPIMHRARCVLRNKINNTGKDHGVSNKGDHQHKQIQENIRQ
jgi:hypothetical protein